MTRTFEDFTEDQWIGWLQGFLSHEKISPPLPVIEDRYAEVLIALFRKLGSASAASRFSSALARLFETTPSEFAFAESIYILLHAMAVATSDRGKFVLRRRLREQAFDNLEYGGVALQCFLLSVAGVYDIDEWMADYVRSSTARVLKSRPGPRRDADFIRNYVLLGFRLIARRSVSEARIYLDSIIPALDGDGACLRLFSEELLDLIIDQGWRQLLCLYVDSAEESGWDARKPRFISETVRKHTLPFIEDNENFERDSFFVTLDFVVNAQPETLRAQHLHIALTAINGMSSEADKELGIRALRVAYQSTDGGWEYELHSDEEIAGLFRDDTDTVALFVFVTGSLVLLDRAKDKGVLEILAQTMPRPFDRVPSRPSRDRASTRDSY